MDVQQVFTNTKEQNQSLFQKLNKNTIEVFLKEILNFLKTQNREIYIEYRKVCFQNFVLCLPDDLFIEFCRAICLTDSVRWIFGNEKIKERIIDFLKRNN